MFLPGSGGAQIHEFNPSQFPPVGLFWTVPLPASGVEVDLTNGTATMKAVKVRFMTMYATKRAVHGQQPTTSSRLDIVQGCLAGRRNNDAVTSTDPTKGIFSGTLCDMHRANGVAGCSG